LVRATAGIVLLAGVIVSFYLAWRNRMEIADAVGRGKKMIM
jgi:hypothetical protein